MIPLILQDYLVNTELPKLFENDVLKNTKGELVSFNFYAQYLPAKSKNVDEFPYINVILLNGEDTGPENQNTANLQMLIGICDDKENYQGYKDCVNVLQKMYNHLMTKKIIDNRFIIEYPISWRMTEENFYPYFFAVLNTKWSFGKVTENDILI